MTDQRAVGVDARARVVQHIVVLLPLAGRAVTADVVRGADDVTTVQQGLEDLVVIALGGQDHGGDVWGEGVGHEPLARRLFGCITKKHIDKCITKKHICNKSVQIQVCIAYL